MDYLDLFQSGFRTINGMEKALAMPLGKFSSEQDECCASILALLDFYTTFNIIMKSFWIGSEDWGWAALYCVGSSFFRAGSSQ